MMHSLDPLRNRSIVLLWSGVALYAGDDHAQLVTMS